MMPSAVDTLASNMASVFSRNVFAKAAQLCDYRRAYDISRATSQSDGRSINIVAYTLPNWCTICPTRLPLTAQIQASRLQNAQSGRETAKGHPYARQSATLSRVHQRRSGRQARENVRQRSGSEFPLLRNEQHTTNAGHRCP